MYLPSIAALLAARAQVTARHGGHDEPYPTTSSLLTSTDSTFPSNNATAGQSTVSQLPLLCSATATPISPWPSSYGSRNPYTNATSGGRHESASPTSPTHNLPATITAPSNELWSLHWPSSSLLTSSSTPNPSLPNVTPTLATSTTSACPAQYSQSPYITMSMASSTTTLQATSSSTQGTHNVPVRPIPILHNPGLLPIPDAQTSTIHITVTASVPSTSPTESPLRESTITSTIMSTLTKTVKSTMAQPSSAVSASSTSSAPSSLGLGKSSAMPPMAPSVRTSVMSPDPRCPYPLPGVYCGDAKTTIITETRTKETSITSAPVAPEGNKGVAGVGWCPYPGGQC